MWINEITALPKEEIYAMKNDAMKEAELIKRLLLDELEVVKGDEEKANFIKETLDKLAIEDTVSLTGHNLD